YERLLGICAFVAEGHDLGRRLGVGGWFCLGGIASDLLDGSCLVQSNTAINTTSGFCRVRRSYAHCAQRDSKFNPRQYLKSEKVSEISSPTHNLPSPLVGFRSVNTGGFLAKKKMAIGSYFPLWRNRGCT